MLCLLYVQKEAYATLVVDVREEEFDVLLQ